MLLKLLDIQGSTVTTDAVETQLQIMEQFLSQQGHFVLMVKKNLYQSDVELVSKIPGHVSTQTTKIYYRK